jgi:hypothetical protein
MQEFGVSRKTRHKIFGRYEGDLEGFTDCPAKTRQDRANVDSIPRS